MRACRTCPRHAAAEIEPVSRMLSHSLTLPGPIRAPDSNTMLTLSRAIPALCHARGSSAVFPFATRAPARLPLPDQGVRFATRYGRNSPRKTAASAMLASAPTGRRSMFSLSSCAPPIAARFTARR